MYNQNYNNGDFPPPNYPNYNNNGPYMNNQFQNQRKNIKNGFT